ncbi:hypothetical protein QOS_0197, partial [Clostridioides difficile Y184]
YLNISSKSCSFCNIATSFFLLINKIDKIYFEEG